MTRLPASSLRVVRRAGLIPEFDVFDQVVRVAIVRQFGATLEILQGECDLQEVGSMIAAGQVRPGARGGIQ